MASGGASGSTEELYWEAARPRPRRRSEARARYSEGPSLAAALSNVSAANRLIHDAKKPLHGTLKGPARVQPQVGRVRWAGTLGWARGERFRTIRRVGARESKRARLRGGEGREGGAVRKGGLVRTLEGAEAGTDGPPQDEKGAGDCLGRELYRGAGREGRALGEALGLGGGDGDEEHGHKEGHRAHAHGVVAQPRLVDEKDAPQRQVGQEH